MKLEYGGLNKSKYQHFHMENDVAVVCLQVFLKFPCVLSSRKVSPQKYFVFMKLFRASSFTHCNELDVKTEDMHLCNEQCHFLHPIVNGTQNNFIICLVCVFWGQ